MAEKPDKEIREAAAESALASLMGGRRQLQPKHVVLPGLGVPAVLAVLSQTDTAVCRANAFIYVAGLGVNPNDKVMVDLYVDECHVEILARALRDPRDEKNGFARPFARDAQEVRDLLTPDQRAAAFDLFVNYQREIDPAAEDVTEEQALEIHSLIKKKAARELTALGSFSLASFLLFMESRQLLSPIGKSEPSPP
jgi:hypothetical protein